MVNEEDKKKIVKQLKNQGLIDGNQLHRLNKAQQRRDAAFRCKLQKDIYLEKKAKKMDRRLM